MITYPVHGGRRGLFITAVAVAAAVLLPARASASPPPAIASPWWQSGHAWCTNAPNAPVPPGNKVVLRPPGLAMRPSSGWMSFYWRSILKTWDSTRNVWLQDRTSGWTKSNPISPFAYDLGTFTLGQQTYPMDAGRRLYTYAMVQTLYHFNADWDDAMYGVGGTWTNGEARWLPGGNAYLTTVVGGACYFP
jgi:hypothetical protein